MEHNIRKRRSFISELLLWILLLVVVPLLALMAYFYIHTLSGLKQIEEEKSVLVSQAAQKSIVNLGGTILGVTITNGYWEDNLQAVLNNDKEWFNTNIGDMPDVVPNVDFVAETDLQGNVLIQAGDVAEFADRIRYDVILERFKKEESFTGMMNTSKGIAVIAVSQVTGDVGEKDSVGLLITGRLLTNEIMEELKDTLQTDVVLLLNSGQFLSSSEELEAASITPYLNKLAQEETKKQFKLERDNGIFVAKVAEPFLDMAGNTVGVLYTQSPSVSTTEAADSLVTMGIYSLAIMVFLLMLVIYLLNRRILQPLRHFTMTMVEVAAGRTVEEIPKHVMQAEAQIVGAIQQIMQWNQVLEQTVQLRTAAVRNLLDNAQQGFLSMSSSLVIEDEYSVECTRIFGCDIAGMKLSQLLYPDDDVEGQLLSSILTQYFAQEDEMKKELIFSLLPEEVVIQNLTVRLEYKPISNSQSLMVVLTDLTETRRLEERVEVERRVLQMVVQVVTHPEEYIEIMSDYEHLHQGVIAEIDRNPNDEFEPPMKKALSIYKAVHTLKGSFGFLRFIHIGSKLHELESGLKELLDQADNMTSLQLASFLQLQHLENWLDEDLALLRHTLGESFESLGQDAQQVNLSHDQWQEIVGRLDDSLVTQEDRTWLADLKAMRRKPFKSLVKHYPMYLTELAERIGILVYPIELTGGDVQVDTERYAGFAKSLVHIMRNIVVHGIESPEERLALGKNEYGTVTFTIVEPTSGGLCVTVADDGRGIDIDALRSKALNDSSWGDSNQSESDFKTDEEILQLIFREQFSTADEVSELAGRGIGLSAVKMELDELKGNVQVRTKLGEGTAFIFTLPDDATEGEDKDEHH